MHTCCTISQQAPSVNTIKKLSNPGRVGRAVVLHTSSSMDYRFGSSLAVQPVKVRRAADDANTAPTLPTDHCATPTPRCHRSPLPRRKRASFMFVVSVVALVSLAYVTAATVTLRARWLTCRRSKSSKSMCPPSMSSRPPSCPAWPPQTGLVGEWSQTACSTWPCCCRPLRAGTARHRPWAPLCWT